MRPIMTSRGRLMFQNPTKEPQNREEIMGITTCNFFTLKTETREEKILRDQSGFLLRSSSSRFLLTGLHSPVSSAPEVMLLQFDCS